MTAYARATDPATSHEAAAGISDDETRTSEQAVLSAFRLYGPMTLDELEATIRSEFPGRWSDQRVRTAQSNLRKRGLLEAKGIHRPASGRKRMIIGTTK